MKPGLSLKVSQHLSLTPQLQQSIRLLQLSTLELQQEVGQMLDDNPFLELDAHDPAAAPDADVTGVEASFSAPTERSVAASETIASDSAYESDEGQFSSDSVAPGLPDADWGGDGSQTVSADDAEWGNDAGSRATSREPDDDGGDVFSLSSSHESLAQALEQQALGLMLSPVDRAAVSFIIGSLNDDGYLEDGLQDLAESLAGADSPQLDEVVHHLTVALRLVQHMEPVGVGARHLGECLDLQLRVLDERAEPGESAAVLATARQVVAQPLDLLARRDVRRLMQVCHEPEARIRAALQLIARLEPKPGRRFVDTERMAITPDVIVKAMAPAQRGGVPRFSVVLNPDVMPRLRVQDMYANALKAHKGGGQQALQQRLQEARWFIKNIQQRFDTILRVSTAIVERQKSFFMHGELAMRPLVLREIADELGLHESTISRVTTAKYMATPYGTFELKYFFGSALGTETGGNASSTAVKALIRQFVAAEPAGKPLSDNTIADLLREQGIECARRTVAKYREALRIAPANLRKAL
jgi:RNA polymerase sigma-54 factor